MTSFKTFNGLIKIFYEYKIVNGFNGLNFFETIQIVVTTWIWLYKSDSNFDKNLSIQCQTCHGPSFIQKLIAITNKNWALFTGVAWYSEYGINLIFLKIHVMIQTIILQVCLNRAQARIGAKHLPIAWPLIHGLTA